MGKDLSQRILDVLRQHGEIRLAILFGSVAANAASRGSDLDLAVLMDETLSLEIRIALIADLSLVAGRPIDLVDLRIVGEPLLGQILRHGLRLAGDSASYAELLKRHLFNEADFLPYHRRILAERRRAWIGK